MGASPGALVRQLLTESVLLSLMEAGAGAAHRGVGRAGAALAQPGEPPPSSDVGLDPTVLLYTWSCRC
ncbi:MAG: hypothetical protein U0133_06380 [Gemmatimonadales bacterium]